MRILFGGEIVMKLDPITISPPQKIGPTDAFRQTWIQLVGHTKPGHSTVDTLNRLLVKHFHNRFSGEQRLPPVLQERDITVRFEWLPTQEAAALWRGHRRDTPGGPNMDPMIVHLPVVIARIGPLDYLIDGNTRINQRIIEMGYPLHSRSGKMLGWRTAHPNPLQGSTTLVP